MGLYKVKEFFEEHRDETLIILGIAIGTVFGPQIVSMAYNAYSSLKAFIEAKLSRKKSQKEQTTTT